MLFPSPDPRVQHGIVHTSAGERFYVDDAPFARSWFAKSGWLSVFTIPDADAVTIRTPGDPREGVQLHILHIEPVTYETARKEFDDAG